MRGWIEEKRKRELADLFFDIEEYLKNFVQFTEDLETFINKRELRFLIEDMIQNMSPSEKERLGSVFREIESGIGRMKNRLITPNYRRKPPFK